jgi:hypothetical protein
LVALNCEGRSDREECFGVFCAGAVVDVSLFRSTIPQSSLEKSEDKNIPRSGPETQVQNPRIFHHEMDTLKSNTMCKAGQFLPFLAISLLRVQAYWKFPL